MTTKFSCSVFIATAAKFGYHHSVSSVLFHTHTQHNKLGDSLLYFSSVVTAEGRALGLYTFIQCCYV